MQYLDRYTPEQARRHEVKPGITGWAQVNGRNAISWEDKFKLDVWYVDNWSVWLDVRIILMTVLKVLKREGISQPGQATAEKFMGKRKAHAKAQRRKRSDYKLFTTLDIPSLISSDPKLISNPNLLSANLIYVNNCFL
jgi:hypothetical protein